MEDSSLSRVSVDTTVMEKNIAHPTDARLYDKARRQLVALAAEAGITLRQNYNRLSPRLAMQAGRYAHARQFKRMRKALKKLKGYAGRVMRDLRRQLDAIPAGPLRERVLDGLVLVGRLLHQGPKSRGKLYALHEPELDCISKGKARKRYEFGTKVSLATTIDEGFVVGMRSMPGNPYDGHTLPEALEQVEILTGQTPALAVVDRGYRGHGVTHTQVLISGTRRGLTPAREPPAATAQRHRARNRPHENRQPPVALPAQGQGRRRDLRRPLRLRAQYPQNPRPPQGSFGSFDRRDRRCHGRAGGRKLRQQSSERVARRLFSLK